MTRREPNIPGTALLCAVLSAAAICIICAVTWWPK